MEPKKTTGTSRRTAAGYETPEGIFTGMPPIAYPNTPGFSPKKPVMVGGEILADEPIEYNINRRTVKLTVRNTGDRPIQIGSHFHFFEVNRYMEFDRPAAFGCHLNIPATTAVRFEPGEEKEVELVAFGGKRRIVGFNNLTMGYAGYQDEPTYYPTRLKAIRKMENNLFKSIPEAEAAAAAQAAAKTAGKPAAKTQATAAARTKAGASPSKTPKH